MKVDGSAMIKKELWKKFYDVASHLGAYKQELPLASGEVLVLQNGPIQDLSTQFGVALENDTALSMISELEQIVLERGFSCHAYAPKRKDLTKSEFYLFGEDGKMNREVLALQIDSFPPSMYIKKNKD